MRDDPWWQIEARKHPGCWITVLEAEHRIVLARSESRARSSTARDSTVNLLAGCALSWDQSRLVAGVLSRRLALGDQPFSFYG